jgi:Lrp/AsnC family leucine-responsive transcriptional regulator
MDKTDRKILQVLQANARASLQDISHAAGLSATPCWARIKKMEEAGVIEGYTIRLNPQAIGLGDTVLVQVTLDSHSDNTLEKFGETLAAIPEVIEAWLVSGEYDYLLRVAVKDTQGLRAFAARAAVQDQGHTPQQIKLCAAHAQEGRPAAVCLRVMLHCSSASGCNFSWLANETSLQSHLRRLG